MIKKNIHQFAVATGTHGTAPAKSGTVSPLSKLFTRMLRALHSPQPETLHLHMVKPLAEATGSVVQYERHCASESEAREFAAAMTRQGTRAEVAYDPYDYSWSVEVYGPADHLPRQHT